LSNGPIYAEGPFRDANYCTVFEEVLGSLGKYSCMQAIYTSLQALVQADDNLKVVSRAWNGQKSVEIVTTLTTYALKTQILLFGRLVSPARLP
jgi:hypothetical protein